MDPVSILLGCRGRAYVAECRDPLGVGPGGKVGSTIRRRLGTPMEMESRTGPSFSPGILALDQVSLRGGAASWHMAPPDILFLRTPTGTEVADIREVVSPASPAGFPIAWSTDCASVRTTGSTEPTGQRRQCRQSADSRGRPTAGEDDFSFDPDTGEVVRTSRSGGGFGLVFDDFGRAFTTYNINHLQHRFLLRKNAEQYPGFPPADLTASVSDHGEMSEIFPISAASTRPNHPSRRAISTLPGPGHPPLSTRFLRDLRDPPSWGRRGQSPYRDVLRPDGPGFSGRGAGIRVRVLRVPRARRSDPWVPKRSRRGTVPPRHAAGRYRAPDYIPEKVRRDLDLRAGADRGRIYRLYPTNAPQIAPVQPALDTADLPHPGRHPGPHQFLVAPDRPPTAGGTGRRHRRGIPSSGGNVGGPTLPRVAALWTLRGIHRLRAEDLLVGLQDLAPGVRENCMILAEDFHDEPRVHAAVCRARRIPTPRPVPNRIGAWGLE